VSVGRLGLTPSQTVGPYFLDALSWPDGPYVVPLGTAGGFWVRGRVYDGAGDPVPDALVETWQADPAGRFDHPDDPRGAVAGWRGFGRCPTGEAGDWEIWTVRPGALPGPDGTVQAPHLDVSVLARGLLDRVVTRIYFAGAPENAADPVLSGLGDRARTLLAAPDGGDYTFDIHLQGADETVFFRV
jgi:protocatechuate 3,4-dioxygenase, alpha subunit